ncbi:LysR family transcriptional regulator [Paramixta manurensis]|uniref:LysR family transcriptional regulator n=1 Tax=Paramixta manurensis TaxID=2740817 RepID=A0A6M8UFC5_9GAMM|nr:LysR family transcriptional regulator [Erwiniaceae bacterium PD-1]
MTLTQLQAFTLAARTRSFSAAAGEMGISQPGVSELIARLESELNTKLFNRAKRNLVITAAGELLLPFAEQSLASVQQGTLAVKSMMSLGGGIASFGVLRNADFYLGTNLARNFHRLYPNVQIRLTGLNSAETAFDVASGHLEAGLVTLPVNDEGLDVVPLARDEVLYVTADKKRASNKPTIHDLLKAPLVLYDVHYAETDPARRQLNERTRLAGIRLNPIIEVEYLNSALALVQEGIGDTIVCNAATAYEGWDKKLYTVPFAEPLYDTLALIKRKGQLLSPATRELARLAHESLIRYQQSEKGTTEILATAAQTASFFF